MYVEWAGYREASTRNTGALADQDTVGTGDIDADAVTAIYAASDGAETTNLFK